MDQQQKIAISGRLRELRNASTETNRSIADAADVAERSVANWMSGETGMKYEHAKVVANLFGVDVTWLWTGEHSTGPNGPTPDPFANRTQAATAVDRIEADLQSLLHGQAELNARVLKVERLLEDQRKQRQPAARTRKAKGN